MKPGVLPSQPRARCAHLPGAWAVVIMLAVGSHTVSGATPPTALDSRVQAFLTKHCQVCHSGAKPKGRFDVTQLAPDFADKAGRERWRAVLEQLQAGEMPPKEKPRPAPQEIKIVTD